MGFWEGIRRGIANLYALFGGLVVWFISAGIGASVGGTLGDVIFYIGTGFFILVCISIMVQMAQSFLSVFLGKGR